MQKFRIDFNGQRNLRLAEESKFTFKMPRYAELLLDSYIVITLPSIWSPIYPPQTTNSTWHPYEFKWIKNLGTQMIKEVEISVGGGIIQKYSGQYLYNMIPLQSTSLHQNPRRYEVVLVSLFSRSRRQYAPVFLKNYSLQKVLFFYLH